MPSLTNLERRNEWTTTDGTDKPLPETLGWAAHGPCLRLALTATTQQNIYCYLPQIAPPDVVTHVAFGAFVRIPNFSDVPRVRQGEMDFDLVRQVGTAGNMQFNGGWAFRLIGTDPGLWHYFSVVNQAWIKTAIPVPKPARLVAGFRVDFFYTIQDDTINFDTVQIDNMSYHLNYSEKARPTKWTSHCNIAGQLDGNGIPCVMEFSDTTFNY